jgi:hypothetical protein
MDEEPKSALKIAQDAYQMAFRATGQSAMAAGDGIVWRPGAQSRGNVLATWPEVQSVLDLVRGALTVYVDPSIAPAQVPAGLWNGYGAAKLASWNAATGFVMGVLDGAVLLDFASLRDMVALCECRTVSAFKFSPLGSFYMAEFGVLANDVGALVPVIDVLTGDQEFALVSRLGTLDNSRAPAVPIVRAGVGTLVTFYMQCAAPNFSALFTGNEIGGPVGATVDWENDASVPPLASALFTGTLSPSATGDAGNQTYEPAVLAHWSGVAPTSIANALDRIAAKITPIP